VLALDLLAVGLVAAGLAGLAFGQRGDAAPPAHVSGTLPSRPPAAIGTPRSGVPRDEKPHVPHGAPTRLSIPAAGIDAPIIPLGLNRDGTLAVPVDFGVAGWYRLGPRPGKPGSAVIVGHLDSTSGPAVFYRLGKLSPGDLVRVSWPSGSSVRFRVYAVREYAKSAFPTSLVYGSMKSPELRLITCGGPFDESAGHYLDNVVVFARLAS
jgi:sortase (surface protein transpeptidase)